MKVFHSLSVHINTPYVKTIDCHQNACHEEIINMEETEEEEDQNRCQIEHQNRHKIIFF
jgi:hypothetical protein